MVSMELLKRAAVGSASGFFVRDGGSRWLAAELLGRLEEEKAKILVFQREIPLSVSIVSYVVDSLKAEQEQEDRRGAPADRDGDGAGAPVLEEFIPVRPEAEAHGEMDVEEEETTGMTKNMANWMSSAQLWSGISNDSDNNTGGNSKRNRSSREVSEQKMTEPERSCESQSAVIGNDNKSTIGGKDLPILASAEPAPAAEDDASKLQLPLNVNFMAPVGAAAAPLPPFSGLSLRTPTIMDLDSTQSAAPQQRLTGTTTATFNGESLGTPDSDQHQGSARKVRRCWSAELHRRFVLALEELGGARVATPKQIRELMKADGLTNDEVKSHLQKYRLHTRKLATPSKDIKKADVRLDLWADSESRAPLQKIRSCSSRSPSSHFDFTGSSGVSL